MAKFVKKVSGDAPGISTSSLPDIIFMLLFFFMVTYIPKEKESDVSVTLPEATEFVKLEKKELVSYIYVGVPVKPLQKVYGTSPRIQLNDTYRTIDDIYDFILTERASRSEADIPNMSTSLKVDKDVKMGVVIDIKQELRKLYALNISYPVTEAK